MRMMTMRQQVAIDNTCRLAEQTIHLRFIRYEPYSKTSTLLTFNSGFE